MCCFVNISYYLEDKRKLLLSKEESLLSLDFIINNNKQNETIIKYIVYLLGNLLGSDDDSFYNIVFNKIIVSILEILDDHLKKLPSCDDINKKSSIIKVIEELAWFFSALTKKYFKFKFKEEEFV